MDSYSGCWFHHALPRGWRCFPHLCCSGSRLLYMEHALRCAGFQPSGVPQKRGTKSCACFLCLPLPSGSGSQELDGRAHSPRVQRAFSPLQSQPQFPPAPVRCIRPVSPRPSRRMSTIQNLRKSLVRNWRPVCSVVGDAVFGARACPFPLPPASCLRRGWPVLQPVSSSLDLLRPFVLRTAGSVFGPVNFLSLLLSHSLSW